MGMPFIFEQHNLDDPNEGHVYFDPGDGCLITAFTDANRKAEKRPPPQDAGHLYHLAITVSQASFSQTVERLDERGITHSGPKDRGFKDSSYFRDPIGMLTGLAPCRFDPPVRANMPMC